MKDILIVVDMQNGFNRYEQTHILADKIIGLTNNNSFDYIIATRFLNKEGSQYTKFLNWHHLINSPETDLIKGIKSDIVVDKLIYTCVNDKFMAFLQEINEKEMPKHVFICGADTDCCVLKIATDLFEQGIMPIVLTDYCDSNGGPESHKAGLLAMKRLIGQKSLVDGIIASKDDVESVLSSRQY